MLVEPNSRSLRSRSGLATPSQNRFLQSALIAAGVTFVPVYANAQQAEATTDQEREVVIVTGVRGSPRTVISSPTPIDVLSAEDIDRVGRAGTLQALSSLAPSFVVPTRAGGGTASVISTGGLRGLNPDQTLILVNGKRRHKTSLINSVSALYLGSVPVDLDLLPTAAIGRIEVLRDGAAAQYGSDAVAGVINIMLKDQSEGGTTAVSWSQNFDREDGQVLQLSGVVGLRQASCRSRRGTIKSKSSRPPMTYVPEHSLSSVVTIDVGSVNSCLVGRSVGNPIYPSLP